MADDLTPPTPPTAPAAAEAKAPELPANLLEEAQTEQHRRAVAAASNPDIKIPSDLSKVSNAKAKELVEAGLADDTDLPAKMYRRKVDGFMARIPNYTFEAYPEDLKSEWEEVKLTSD